MSAPAPIPAGAHDRPSTLDARGDRLHVYPAAFAGLWLRRRTIANIALMVVFFGLPWLTVGGHQAVLLDLPHRKLALFGLVLWPQDTMLLWLLLFCTLIGVFFVTALFGRVWCGWACPQTVFLEGVFRHIERWIEGSPQRRRKLDAAPWTWDKVWRKGLKHLVFVVIASHVANTCLCYFAGTDRVLEMTLRSPADNPGWFAFMGGVSFVFYANFAWFREQLCTMACPYGRWQSVLLDRHSVIVGYDPGRGETRATKGTRRRAAADSAKTPEDQTSFGDCVDCSRCVQVCPTGIDIREGLQMECVGCTACIDACDEVMDRIAKPRGLIRYTSLAALEGEQVRPARPRTMLYGGVWAISLVVFAIVASQRAGVEVQVVRAQKDAVRLDGDTVLNHFRAKLVNKTDAPIKVAIDVPGEDITVPLNPWPVDASAVTTMEIFVRRSRASFGGQVQQAQMVFAVAGTEVHRQSVPLLGPGMRSGAGGR